MNFSGCSASGKLPSEIQEYVVTLDGKIEIVENFAGARGRCFALGSGPVDQAGGCGD